LGDGFNGLAPFGGGEGFQDVGGFLCFPGNGVYVSGEGEFGIEGDAENFGVSD